MFCRDVLARRDSYPELIPESLAYRQLPPTPDPASYTTKSRLLASRAWATASPALPAPTTAIRKAPEGYTSPLSRVVAKCRNSVAYRILASVRHPLSRSIPFEHTGIKDARDQKGPRISVERRAARRWHLARDSRPLSIASTCLGAGAGRTTPPPPRSRLSRLRQPCLRWQAPVSPGRL